MKEDIHVRLDSALMQEVRAYASRMGISLGAAISVLLRTGLRT